MLICIFAFAYVKISLRKLAHSICGDFFSAVKIENLIKNIDILNMFAQNTDCWYTLELPWRGGSKEYPQSMFGHRLQGHVFLMSCCSYLLLFFRKPDIPPRADLMIFVELLQVDPAPDYSSMEVSDRISKA